MNKTILVIFFAFFISHTHAQNPRTYSGSNFTFSVYTHGGASADDVCSVDSIVVIAKNGPKYIQSIVPGENSYTCNTVNDALTVEDMNFDGFEDFRIVQFTGTPNTPYFFWLYDPKSKKFRKSVELEDITSPVFDQKNKTITSDWTDNAAHHGTTIRKYIKGRLTKTKEIDKSADPKDSNYMIVTTRELIAGKWKVVSRSKSKWD